MELKSNVEDSGSRSSQIGSYTISGLLSSLGSQHSQSEDSGSNPDCSTARFSKYCELFSSCVPKLN